MSHPLRQRLKPAVLFILFVASFLVASFGFVPLARAEEPLPSDDFANQIQDWRLVHVDSVGGLNPVPGIEAYAPSDTDVPSAVFFAQLDDITVANQVTYSVPGVLFVNLTVDTCSQNSTSAVYSAGSGGPVAITIQGSASFPCTENPGAEGTIITTVYFPQFDEIIKQCAIGPFEVQVVDTDFNEVALKPDENGVYEQGTATNFFSDYEFTVPEGGYRLYVRTVQDQRVVGETDIIDVIAGINTPVQIVINEDCEGLNQTQYSTRAIRSPCSGLGVGWLICHAVRAVYSGIEFLYEQIVTPLLDVQPLRQTDSNGDKTDIFAIWGNVRILANILFIFIFLAAITGIGTSWMFTQYELKRMLPRLFIGIIAAQLSWYIVAFIVDGGNFIGAGIRGLLLAPARDLPVAGLNPKLAENFLGGFGSMIDVLLSAGGAAILFKSSITAKGVIFALPLILVPIIVAVAIVIFVLSLRHILLVLLAIASPLVFILWSLPGTDGIIKQWWGLFWKLIIMYPLIIALIAGGELASKVIVADRDNDPVFYITGVVVLFAPFFLIPATFNFAGSAIANAASGFDGIKKGINERLFGSTEPGSRGGYLGRVKDYNEAVSQQRLMSSMRDAARFTKDARAYAGLPATGVGLHGLRNFRNWGQIGRNLGRYGNKDGMRRLGRYAMFHLGAGSGGGARGAFAQAMGSFNRASMSAQARLRPTTVDTRMAFRTIAAKKMMDTLTVEQQDAIAHAMFGNYDIFTGEPLPEWAIIEAREYRGDMAAQNAFLKYLVTQATTGEDWQKLFNHYAQWNPYKDPSIELAPGEKLDANKHAMAGKKREFEVYQDGKIGNLKGATFGTQRERKDGKNRTLNPKHDSYIRARGELIWERPDSQVVAESQWRRKVESDPNITRPDSIGNNASDEERAQYKKDMDAYKAKKLEFMEERKEAFLDDYYEENKGNFGLIGDATLPDAVGEVTYGMDYTGQQLGSMIEMLSENAHRMKEVEQNYDDLVAYSVAETEIKQDRNLSDKAKADRLKLLKESTKEKIGNVDFISVEPSEPEKTAYAAEVLGKSPAETTIEDYISLTPTEKGQIHKKKIDEWKKTSLAEVQRSRNLIIDVLESGAMSRPEEQGDDDPIAIQTENPEDLFKRQPWRVNELERMTNYEVRLLEKIDEGITGRLRNEAIQKIESDPEGQKLRGKAKKKAIDRYVVDEAKKQLEQLKQEPGADAKIAKGKKDLHLDRVDEIVRTYQTPNATLEQIQESIDFIKMSEWIEENGFHD